MYSFFPLMSMNSSGESLPHCIMLPETCCSMFGKSLTTDVTGAMSKTVHILNIELDLVVF